MAISLENLVRGKDQSAPRIVLFGPRGIGKTTFASHAEKPIFIQTEDGPGSLDIVRTPLITSFEGIMEWLRLLYKDDHEHKTLVIDSLDWAERLIHEAVKEEHGEKIFTDYGKGYLLSITYFEKIISALNALRAKKQMTIILLAHSQVKRYEAPDTVPYDRYKLDLNDKAAAIFEEWSDAVLFANYKVLFKTDKSGSKEHVRGVGTGERVLYTQERPAHVAKNRYNLPVEMEFAWPGVMEGVRKALA